MDSDKIGKLLAELIQLLQGSNNDSPGDHVPNHDKTVCLSFEVNAEELIRKIKNVGKDVPGSIGGVHINISKH